MKKETIRKCIGMPAEPYQRPMVRGDCENVPRPCPFVGCRHNLFLDYKRGGGRNGVIVYNFPGKEPSDMPEDMSCALDVAECGAATLEKVGEAMGVTAEGARKMIESALVKAIQEECDERDDFAA